MRVLILCAILACVAAAPAPCGPCDVSRGRSDIFSPSSIRSDIHTPGSITSNIISPTEVRTEVIAPSVRSGSNTGVQTVLTGGSIRRNIISPTEVRTEVIAPSVRSENIISTGGSIRRNIISPNEVRTEVIAPSVRSEIIGPSGRIVVDGLRSEITPVTPEVIAPVAAVPVGAPIAKVATVEAGDIEAAAIDAKVAAENAAIAAADKARLLAELQVEDKNDKTMLVTDQVKEKNEEVFWSTEEQKWRYWDAVNTAEAKLDGAIARDATILARSSLGGVALAPLAPIVAPLRPIVAPVAPIVAHPAPLLAAKASVVTPFVYSAPILKIEGQGEKLETIIKTAELQPQMSEEAKVKLAALEKNLDAKPAVLTHPTFAFGTSEPIYKLSESWASQTAKLQSELKKNIEELQSRLEANIQNIKPAAFVPTLHAAPVIAPYKLSEPWLTQVYVPGASYNSIQLSSPIQNPDERSAVKVA